MKNTKKFLSLGVVLAATLFASVQISAMAISLKAALKEVPAKLEKKLAAMINQPGQDTEDLKDMFALWQCVDANHRRLTFLEQQNIQTETKITQLAMHIKSILERQLSTADKK